MEDLLAWLVRVRRTKTVRVYQQTSGVVAIMNGGAIPGWFIDQEIARVKAGAEDVPATTKQVPSISIPRKLIP